MASRKNKSAQQYVVDKASGRIISAGREEIDATQPLLEILIDEAGWDPKQIVSRPKQWRVTASPSGKRDWPVDLAIFSDAKSVREPEHVLIFCECKRPDVDTGIEQLKIYLDREPHARLGIWFNGLQHAIVYKTKTGYEIAPDGTPIPTPQDALVPLGQRVLKIGDLRNAPSLVPVFKRIRDRLVAQDRNVNRDEEILPDISLLLLLKILDEQNNQFTEKKPLAFQIDETPRKTADRIRELLMHEAKKNADLFGSNGRDIRLQIDDDSIHYIVSVLQNYRILSNEVDAVAQAFQVIRGKAYKGEEGQYFTPQSVVRVATAAVNPQPQDRVIDPACGSGSFLATTMGNVVEELRVLYKGNEDKVHAAKRDWCTKQLFAIDKDAVSVRLSKAYLSMLGDGSTHVFKADSIRPKKFQAYEGWGAALGASIQDGTFDVVVTNPPFGTKLKVPPEVGRHEGYELSQEWKKKDGKWIATGDYAERDLGLIFLERSIRLLRKGGRMAIVLPDTYLFSDSYGWLVQWLSQFTITHSINVPIEAFEPHCRAKTSVLVLKKEKPKADHRIIGSYCETFGEDKHGRARFKFEDSGQQTNLRDDEMEEAAILLKAGGGKTDSKLFFRFSQAEAIKRKVLVASYWWRKPYEDALKKFATTNNCELVAIGDLIESGELEVMDGHGSPNSHFVGRGPIPYVKVIEIKNWRVNENPKYGIPEDLADKMRRGKFLQPWDIVTPTRASKNIGLFGVIMPWQTKLILTREIAIWRVTKKKGNRIEPSLLLALMSLQVVHDQFKFLILMQMNREDLSDRYKEMLIPIPKTKELRESWSKHIHDYFTAIATARTSYEKLTQQLDPKLFADRP